MDDIKQKLEESSNWSARASSAAWTASLVRKIGQQGQQSSQPQDGDQSGQPQDGQQGESGEQGQQGQRKASQSGQQGQSGQSGPAGQLASGQAGSDSRSFPRVSIPTRLKRVLENMAKKKLDFLDQLPQSLPGRSSS